MEMRAGKGISGISNPLGLLALRGLDKLGLVQIKLELQARNKL